MAGIRLDKEWIELTDAAVAALPAQLGVYQIADADQAVVKIGYAGALRAFGMRTALGDELAARAGSRTYFRYEINQQYTTRYDELLMVHVADHGELPAENRADGRRIGRLSPS